MKMDGNIDRLPVWAQNRIRHLEQVIASHEEIIRDLRAGPEDSDTFTDVYSKLGPRVLGKGTSVRFGRVEYDSGPVFDVKFNDGELEVRAGSTYREEMVILPRVSNAFTIGFRTRPRP